VSTQVLIATVADPSTSHMQLVADRAIDGQAAPLEGYSFTSYWNPWRTQLRLLGKRSTLQQLVGKTTVGDEPALYDPGEL
jgi:hypothetical protein